MPNTVQATLPHGDAHRHYEELIASVDGIVWEADARTFQFSLVSQQAERLLGYPLALWYAHGFWVDHVHPDDRAWASEFCRQAVIEKRNHDFTYRMIAADGGIVWLRDRVTVVVEGDEVSTLRGIMVDITDRKLAEAERQTHVWFLESLDLINRAIQGASDLDGMMSEVLAAVLTVFECDRAWLIHPCDPAAATCSVVMQRTRPEYGWAGQPWLPVPVDAEFAEVVRAVRTVEGPVRFGTGTDRPLPPVMAQRLSVKDQLAMAVSPKVGHPYLFGLHQCSRPRDWTPQELRLFQEIGRRLADALTSLLVFRSLQDREEKLEASQRMAHIGYWVSDFDANRFTLSDETRRIFGLSSDESFNELPAWHVRWHQLIHPEDLPRIRQAADQAMRTGPVYDQEYRIVRPDGDVRIVHSRADIVRHESGRPCRMFGTLQDVTALKRTENRLKLFRALIDRANDAIEVIDPETGRFLDVNERACQIHGYSREEYLALAVYDLVPGMTREIWSRRSQDLRRAGSDVIEATHRRKDGSSVPVEVNVAHVSLDRDYLIGVVRDITERKQAESEMKQLEEQLRQAQKMEAIGQLAGGVAHDFNNILTVINGNSELLAMSHSADHPDRQLLLEIQRSGERAANLTLQLLSFSRQQLLQPRVICLDALLDNLCAMLRRLIGENIELTFSPGAERGLATVDPTHFEQALINLAINARDAMPSGGHLTIETSMIEVDAAFAARDPELDPGRYVQLTVRDSGHGMPETTRSRIFEPFFTTKGPGSGTGLGLAMVYGFVKQSGGYIYVDSEPGRGTTFSLYLPEAEEAVPTDPMLPESLEVPRGSETILVVEDDDLVRRLAERILRSTGYTVLDARSGEEALSVARHHQGPIHLVLTDVVMPGMGGRRLSEALAQVRPEVKVIFMSGYTDEVVLRQGLEAGAAFVQKPFSPLALAHKVREVLDARAD